jgi:hypothetical protein
MPVGGNVGTVVGAFVGNLDTGGNVGYLVGAGVGRTVALPLGEAVGKFVKGGNVGLRVGRGDAPGVGRGVGRAVCMDMDMEPAKPLTKLSRKSCVSASVPVVAVLDVVYVIAVLLAEVLLSLLPASIRNNSLAS